MIDYIRQSFLDPRPDVTQSVSRPSDMTFRSVNNSLEIPSFTLPEYFAMSLLSVHLASAPHVASFAAALQLFVRSCSFGKGV